MNKCKLLAHIHLQVLIQHNKFTLFRPDLYLYLHLKTARLTEADCSDCLAYINFSLNKNGLDNSNNRKIKQKINKLLQQRKRDTHSEEQSKRLELIIAAILK